MSGTVWIAARPRGTRGSGLAFVATLTIHGAVGALLLARPGEFDVSRIPVYSVELVAAPRPRPDARQAPEALARPAERPAPEARRQSRRAPIAEEMPPPPDQPDVEREPAARTTPDVEPAPDVTPSTGTDVATVKTTGIPFPYPDYLRNIVNQIYRQWRRPSGTRALRAEVLFFIRRDGSVSNLQFVQRSGNFAFDLEAQGAIEAAASANAFGPLPDRFPEDILPVSFFFDPSTTER